MTTPPNPIELLGAFMASRAREVGVTEQQILQMLGIKGAVGPLEALLSGRPAAETIPDLASGLVQGTDVVAKAARQHVEQAMPIVVPEELKSLLKKLEMLNADGLKQLETYLNFLISQGALTK
ncbi:MAG: hypothetical protein VKP62_00895 [Candidatus Sericytochromatia bacterium]|nr:hypothetical protein [Candidatus Sericytochromatia bacterium]